MCVFCYSCVVISLSHSYSHSQSVVLSCVCNVYVCVFCFVYALFPSSKLLEHITDAIYVRKLIPSAVDEHEEEEEEDEKNPAQQHSYTYTLHVQGGSVTITITVTTTSTTSTKMSQTFPIHFMCNFCYLTTNRSKKLFSRLRRTLGKHKSHDRKITIAHNKNIECKKEKKHTHREREKKGKTKQNKTHDKIIRSVIYKREKNSTQIRAAYRLLILWHWFNIMRYS